MPWTYFVNALTQSSNSIVNNRALVTRVYFPRLIIPFAAVMTGLLDFAIAFAILLGMMQFYGIMPTTAVLILPYSTGMQGRLVFSVAAHLNSDILLLDEVMAVRTPHFG